MPAPRPDEHDYLRQIELLARDVVDRAYDEGLLTADEDTEPVTPLRRAVIELERRLRHHHFDGDGCLDDERPLLHLGGAALIGPGTTAETREDYESRCDRLGVAARTEGWALWHTWDHEARAHTIVTTALDTTRGLLENWRHGRDVHPVQPDRAQIAAVVNGWVDPAILSPSHAANVGLGGR